MPWAKAASAELTVGRLRELLTYDPETGVFTRRVSTAPRAMAGTVAGDVDSKGYWRLRVDGRRYLAHRLAWFYVHGEWPAEQIDHVNGVRTDNRLNNLRLADAFQNRHNCRCRWDSGSGLKGVSYRRANKKWRAQIYAYGKSVLIGYFPTPDAAHAAYAEAAKTFHGQFARAV